MVGSRKSNLHKVSSNEKAPTAFVRISANWSFDRTYGRLVIFASKLSLIKCLSTSCLVRSCCTGFSKILIAKSLSQKISQFLSGRKPSSVRSFHNDKIRRDAFRNASKLSLSARHCNNLLLLTFPGYKIPSY